MLPFSNIFSVYIVIISWKLKIQYIFIARNISMVIRLKTNLAKKVP